MKKLLQILLSLCILAGCSKTTPPVEEITYDRVIGIQQISYEELVEKLDSPVDFILYIGRPDCGDCKMFQPYLEQYMEEHTDAGIYYLNIKEFRDQANQDNATEEQKEFYDNLKENLGFAWTPTLIHYSNGKKEDAYEFLDSSFGRYDENNQEQQEKLAKFVDDFQNWMDLNLAVPTEEK